MRDLWAIDVDTSDDDSNEVVCAKTLVRIYREPDGISDEMSRRQIEFVNSLEGPLESALAVLSARDLL